MGSCELAMATLADRPCTGCGGRTGALAAVWTPNLQCRRDELGIKPDRPVRIGYAICTRCAQRCMYDAVYNTKVEDRLIASFRRNRGGSVPASSRPD